MPEAAEEVDGRVGADGLREVEGGLLVARGEDLFCGGAVDHAVEVPRLHLPDVGGAVAAADDEEVVEGAPLDGHDGEEVSRGEHDAAPLLQREDQLIHSFIINYFINYYYRPYRLRLE